MAGMEELLGLDGLNNADFFVSVDPAVKVFCIVGLFWLLPCISYAPHLLPSPTYTSYFGTFLLYLREEHLDLCRFVFIGSILIHLLEMSFALVFCLYLGISREKTRKWMLSTFLYGGFSLVHLVKRLYHDEAARKKYDKSTVDPKKFM